MCLFCFMCVSDRKSSCIYCTKEQKNIQSKHKQLSNYYSDWTADPTYNIIPAYNTRLTGLPAHHRLTGQKLKLSNELFNSYLVPRGYVLI